MRISDWSSDVCSADLSIPCTTPPNRRCQSQLGGGLIHGEGNRIDSIPLPDWLANPRDKINGESIKVLSLHGLAGAVGHMLVLFLDRTNPIKDSGVLNRYLNRPLDG